MIDSISHIAAQQLYNQNVVQHSKLKQSGEVLGGVEGVGITNRASGPQEGAFDNVVGKLIKEVDGKSKVAIQEGNRVMLGETDNIHQSMVASQEASLAFTMMVELRNKLMNSYQELMKMPV